MATNQMRREAAKRKLERQQERRIEQARKRRRNVVITVVGVVVLVAALVVVLVMLPKGSAEPTTEAAAAATPTATPAAPAALGDCTFTPTPSEPAAKAAPVPPSGPTATTGTQAATIATSSGPIPVTLDRTSGPCAVESFVSLAKAGYFNDTTCHRLTTGEGLKVLQCGDPTGTGSGGPGYTINDESPTKLGQPTAQGTVTYPRGTLAMAKTSAPNSGGSQFFLVYGDSTLQPDYTVFGTIDAAGLTTLDKIAKAGEDDSNGTGDGKPKTPVNITTVTTS